MHSAKYPIISRMAKDVFAAPASTVAFEAAFSTTGRVVSEYRSRLTSKNIIGVSPRLAESGRYVFFQLCLTSHKGS
jgi:hypothetical protein